MCLPTNSFGVGFFFVTIPWNPKSVCVCVCVFALYVILNSIGQFSTVAKTIVVGWHLRASSVHYTRCMFNYIQPSRRNTHTHTPRSVANGWDHEASIRRKKIFPFISLSISLPFISWMLIENGTISSRFQVYLDENVSILCRCTQFVTLLAWSGSA